MVTIVNVPYDRSVIACVVVMETVNDNEECVFSRRTKEHCPKIKNVCLNGHNSETGDESSIYFFW